MKKRIVVLTIDFPDSFLLNEVPFLSTAFDEIFVLPMVMQPDPFNLPPNVSVHQLFGKTDLSRPWPLIRRHLFAIIRIFGSTLKQKGNAPAYLKYYRSFLGYLLPELEKVKPLKDFIDRHHLHDALFYDYWFVDATITLAELKRQGVIKHTIARAHGFDLYDERQFEGRVSFREYRADHLDAIYTISDHGFRYLRSKLSPALASKIHLSYLGIPDRLIQGTRIKFSEQFTIVSCARMIPLKRIERIAAVLSRLSVSVRWIHFGDGPMKETVEKVVANFPAHVIADLRGRRTNAEIIDFYNSHHVDMLISLSESEGLPVSMMEAISFGIPVFACNINGVGEIVTPLTGHLIPVELPEELVAVELENTLLHQKFNPADIHHFFLTRFEAGHSFGKFTSTILGKLSADNQSSL